MRPQICEKAVNSINGFLEQIAKEVKTVMGQLCTDHGKRDEVVSNTLLYYNVYYWTVQYLYMYNIILFTSYYQVSKSADQTMTEILLFKYTHSAGLQHLVM